MKLFITILLLLSFNGLYAQEASTKKISYGVEFQSSLLSLNQEDGSLLNITNTLGTSLSGCVFITLNESLSFKTGLSLNQRTIRFKDYSPVFASDIAHSSGIDEKASWFQYDFQIFYFGIPAQVKWNLSQNKNHLYVKAGAETYFKISSSEKSHIFESRKKSSELKGNLDGFSSILLIAELGFGYEFSLKNEKQFYIESVVEHAVNSVFESNNLVIENNSINTISLISTDGNYYNFGLAAGIIF